MTDIYDDAIEATLKHDRIINSWVAGGDESIPLHGLLFRSCPHLGCCLTEYKNKMGEEDLVLDILDELRDDDLMPSTQGELEIMWLNEPDTKARTTLLERFAMYNRGLDEAFDREPANIEGE